MVALSVNGRFVAWRTWRAGSGGDVFVGRVSRGRIAAVRRTPAAAVPVRRAIDGRFVVVPDGTVAWALDAGSTRARPSRLWVWPRGRDSREVDVPSDQRRRWQSVRLLDDRHLLLDASSTPVAFASPSPGRCPSLTSGSWRRLGSWRAAAVPSVEFFGEDFPERWSWIAVCDPVSGRYLGLFRERDDGDHYGTTSDGVGRLAAMGPWLVADHRISDPGSASGTTPYAEIVDSRTGARHRARSASRIAGIDAPDVLAPAATMAPGALTWNETAPTDAPGGASPGRDDVWLSDANGTRIVGQGPASGASAAPALETSQVTWASDGGRVAAPVAAATDWGPPVVLALTPVRP